ncbi:MAG: TRAP transporter substrate-binding protein DctP [Pseudomonadales bacterium]|nr:TRAP transporter substrate-binding protein DctP [Pseudomonadales bacterium]
MKRREFVTALGVGAVASTLAACGAKECDNESAVASETSSNKEQKIKWKLVTSWPKNFPGLGTAPENMAKLVSKMTGGKFQIKVYGAGELVPAMEVFDAVSQGTAEIGHSAAYYWKGKIPAASFFTAVPFGMTAQEMNGWIHYGGGLELWRELYKPFGILPVAGGNTGVQMAGWYNKEINSIDDIKGLKMRIPGLAGEVWERLGGTAVRLPGGELFTSLQTGAIDATEWVGPYNDLAFGLYKAAKFYYYPGWHEPGAMLEFEINQKAYDQLSEEYKNILTTACRAVNQDMLDEYTARNNSALRDLVEKHNVQLRRMPDDVFKKLKEVSASVVSDVATKDEISKRIYESHESFKKSANAYHQISEKAYLNARDI